MTLNLLFFCFALFSSLLFGMDTTFLKPTILYPKTRFATKNLTSLQGAATYFKADNALNDRDQETGNLSYQGTEQLFSRFVNPELPAQNTGSVGKALISGNITTSNYRLIFAQNIGSSWFMQFSTALSQQQLKNLEIQPAKNNCRLLAPSEIEADSTLKNYLQKLNNLIFVNNSCAILCCDSVGPTFGTIGYTYNFQNFIRLDFIDVTFQAGILIPEYDLFSSSNSLFQLSPNKLVNIGIPLQISTQLGVFDWFNCGTTMLLIAYFSNDQKIPLSSTPSNNAYLIGERGFATIHHYPSLYINAYAEAEHLIPSLSLLFGISYFKQFQTTYKSWDMQTFSNEIINKYPTHKPWELLSCVISTEFDFATEERKNLPYIKLFYSWPIFGKSVLQTSALSGQLGFELTHEF